MVPSKHRIRPAASNDLAVPSLCFCLLFVSVPLCVVRDFGSRRQWSAFLTTKKVLRYDGRMRCTCHIWLLLHQLGLPRCLKNRVKTFSAIRRRSWAFSRFFPPLYKMKYLVLLALVGAAAATVCPGKKSLCAGTHTCCPTAQSGVYGCCKYTQAHCCKKVSCASHL